VTGLLVLWDVDYTLADTGRVGRVLYEQVFAEMFGGEAPQPGSMAGRTDRAIVLEVLTLAGLADPARHVRDFEALLARRAAGVSGLLRQQGRALPGAAQAIAQLAARPQVVQSLLTGNIRELAEVKVRALGLSCHLDFDVGAYGDASEVRADLVPLARRRAAQAYRQDFAGHGTVLVGDTPHDVAAALATGARAVGVATGSFRAAELEAAGAHAVLPDLADTRQAVAAILGPPGR
jgi:phosphoglycolate phosphatase